MIKNMQQQFGFIPPVIVPEDFWLGSKKLGSQVINEKGDWRGFLPELEIQRINFETNSCVSFGTNSALEMIAKLLWKVEPNYSDRFLSKMSDTVPESGNTPKKVSETLRHSGCVSEEKWPMTQTLEEYFKEISEDIKKLGLEWLKQYDFGYEYVASDKLKEALKRSPVGVAVSAWQQNEKGEYVYFGQWNHWVVLVFIDEGGKNYIWDSYDKGIKILEKDYNFGFPQIYKLEKKTEKKVGKSLWQRIIDFLKQLV